MSLHLYQIISPWNKLHSSLANALSVLAIRNHYCFQIRSNIISLCCYVHLFPHLNFYRLKNYCTTYNYEFFYTKGYVLLAKSDVCYANSAYCWMCILIGNCLIIISLVVVLLLWSLKKTWTLDCELDCGLYSALLDIWTRISIAKGHMLANYPAKVLAFLHAISLTVYAQW